MYLCNETNIYQLKKRSCGQISLPFYIASRHEILVFKKTKMLCCIVHLFEIPNCDFFGLQFDWIANRYWSSFWNLNCEFWTSIRDWIWIALQLQLIWEFLREIFRRGFCIDFLNFRNPDWIEFIKNWGFESNRDHQLLHR